MNRMTFPFFDGYCQEIAQLEDRLPPRRGWHRLRYLNPWVVTWGGFAVSLAVNGVRIWLQVKGGG